MMLNALLKDCVDLGSYEIITTRDKRLPGLMHPVQAVVADGDVYRLWRACMHDADATVIIAPEHENILLDLTRMAESGGHRVLGCPSSSIQWTSSKMQTAMRLVEHNIPHMETRWLDDVQCVDGDGGWVVKPDDGVGAEACYFCADQQALNLLKHTIDTRGFIIQKYVAGIPASLSMVCDRGRAKLLACNQQLFEFHHGRGLLSGVIVNGLVEHSATFSAIADSIAGADENLLGYVGVDLIVTATGAPIVVEINSRLTTSYVGLRRSISENPASHILFPRQGRDIVGIDGARIQPVNILFKNA